MSSANDVRSDLSKLADSGKAALLSRFFKTGKGQYGEGDVFLGITVPQQREVAKKRPDLPLSEVQKLLSSAVHEQRLTGLLVLVARYSKADAAEKKRIFDFYLANAGGINNWDLVDLSAPNIAGDFLLARNRSPLYRLAKSRNMWERRIAMVSTYAFIRKDQFEDALKIAEMLLDDQHDLIHKATGWMLREVGKRDQAAEERFLRKHCRRMPRTALRYAIERFDEAKRKRYMRRS